MRKMFSSEIRIIKKNRNPYLVIIDNLVKYDKKNRKEVSNDSR